MTAKRLHDLLSKCRFTLSNEMALQAEIGSFLTINKIEYAREVRLSTKDRIDFMVEGVGIEVKLKGRAMAIYKQCERYCGCPAVKELVLVSNRSMGLPDEINGRPVYLLNLGRAWLT